MVTLGGSSKDAWFTKVNVNGTSVRFKLDTGAEVNLIPQQMLRKIHRGPVRSTKIRLTAFGGDVLTPVGKITARCALKGRNVSLDFYVVDFATTPIIGLNGCTKLKLIDRVEEVQRCGDVQHLNNDVPHQNGGRPMATAPVASEPKGEAKRKLVKNKMRYSRQKRRNRECERNNEQVWDYMMAGRDPIDGSLRKDSEQNKSEVRHEQRRNKKAGKDPIDGSLRKDSEQNKSEVRHEQRRNKTEVDRGKSPKMIGCKNGSYRSNNEFNKSHSDLRASAVLRKNVIFQSRKTSGLSCTQNARFHPASTKNSKENSETHGERWHHTASRLSNRMGEQSHDRGKTRLISENMFGS